MMPDIENQTEGENKFTKLWARRVEKLETLFRQKFCYTPFLFVVCLYTVLIKSDVSLLELVIAFSLSLLTSYVICTLEGIKQ